MHAFLNCNCRPHHVSVSLASMVEHATQITADRHLRVNVYLAEKDHAVK